MYVYVVTFSNGLIYGIYAKRESAKTDAEELFERIINSDILNDGGEVKKYYHEDNVQICFSAWLNGSNIQVNIRKMEVFEN